MTVDKDAEKGDDEPAKSGLQPAFKDTDIRCQRPCDRAARVAEVKRSLSTLKDDGSGKTRAKIKSLLYKLKVLTK